MVKRFEELEVWQLSREQNKFDDFYERTQEISRSHSGFIKYLNQYISECGNNRTK